MAGHKVAGLGWTLDRLLGGRLGLWGIGPGRLCRWGATGFPDSLSQGLGQRLKLLAQGVEGVDHGLQESRCFGDVSSRVLTRSWMSRHEYATPVHCSMMRSYMWLWDRNPSAVES